MDTLVRSAVTDGAEHEMEKVDFHGPHAKDHSDNNLPPSWHPQLPKYRHRKRDHNDVQNEIDDRGN